jgi:hypothetical protein
MGFALWTDAGLAWAAGTSEYRAMGAAVVSDTDLFRAADFRPRVGQALPPATFAGHFASLGQINDYLVKRRRPSQQKVSQGVPLQPRMVRRHGAGQVKLSGSNVIDRSTVPALHVSFVWRRRKS